MTWQPIETAPQNVDVLVLLGGEVFSGAFNGGHWEFPYADYHGCGCCSGINDRPTHWMPLPEPPQC